MVWVDVEGIDVKPGDSAVIFDQDGKNIETLAEAADTICYELVSVVGNRVPRIVTGYR